MERIKGVISILIHENPYYFDRPLGMRLEHAKELLQREEVLQVARTEKDMTKAAREAKELFDRTTLKPAVKRYKASEGPRPKVEVARHKADRNSNKVRNWETD